MSNPDDSPQNIYDDPQFFAGYSQMARFQSGWGRAMEHSHFIDLLVFSTEHPIYTARGSADGWVVDGEGNRIAWALDHYAEEGLREHTWYVPGVRRYHRTLATILNGLIDSGLVIERMIEPAPGDAWLRDRPQDADERRRPMFLLMRARKA